MADAISSQSTGGPWRIVIDGTSYQPVVGDGGIGTLVAHFVGELLGLGHGVKNADITYQADTPLATIPITVVGTEREFSESGHNDHTYPTPSIGPGSIGPGYLRTPDDSATTERAE